jgi:cytidine deaminase
MTKAISEGALKRALAAGLTQLQFIEAIAIYAPKGSDSWPCCNCRQSLNEFGLEMNVIGEDANGSILSKKLSELIPHAFPMESVLAAVFGKDWQTTANQAVMATPAASPRKKSGGKSRKLIEAAKEASLMAYCPYSEYPVGAAILTFDDQIYTGCNVENCGYTQTIHAEQTALAKAVSEGALQRARDAGLTQFEFIKSIAVYAPKGKKPWPSCNGRQSLNEFGLKMQVLGEDKHGTIMRKKLKELIPYAFPMESVLASIHRATSKS